MQKTIDLIVWLTTSLVSLSVGFGMIDGVLSIKHIPQIVTISAGWVVVSLTLLGIILNLIKK